MAVKLRLVRMGKKKQPTYRVVAADSRSPRDGRFLEVLGTYAPRGRSSADDETIFTIDQDKALYWLRQGAKPTDRVERLLRSSGTLDVLAVGAGRAAAEAAPGATDSDESAASSHAGFEGGAAAEESATSATGAGSVPE